MMEELIMRSYRTKGKPEEFIGLSLTVPAIVALLGLILSFVL
jgi:hypothetical protein